MPRFFALTVGLILAFGLGMPVHGQLYSYKDKNGKIFITDKPLKGKKYKLNNYLPPREQESELSDQEEPSEPGWRPNPRTTLTERQLYGLAVPIAKAMKVDPNLVLAVIQIESSGDYRAKSHKGAIGLMQLMPATAERFGIKNAYDPRQNIKGGIRYLRYLLSYFEGNVDYVLAGYNAGEHAVDRHGGIPPYKETQRYVQKIRRIYSTESLPFDQSIKQRSKLVKDDTVKKAQTETVPVGG